MYHAWFALAQEKDSSINVKSTCQKSFSKKIINYDMLGVPDKYKSQLEVVYHSEDVVILNKLILKSEKDLESATRDFVKKGWSVSDYFAHNQTNRNSVKL